MNGPGFSINRKINTLDVRVGKNGFIMLKRDLISKVAENMNGYLKKDITQAIDIMMETIADALVEGRRVEIRGFGSFSVRDRKAKETKNPRTGDVMHIPPRKTLHFTMSKSLKEPLISNKNK